MRLFLQKNGTNIEILPGSTVKLKHTITAVSGSTLSVNMDIDELFDDYKGSKYVTTINGYQAGKYGDFYIEGSECTSWSYTDSDIEYSGNKIVHGAILVADMCPSCVKCESIYRLKYEFENMKMWINMLKDVNLYNADDTLSRRDSLSSLRITGATSACGVFPNDNPGLKGTQLFKEYVTMLHMWNYVVSTNNYSNLIQLAPEDTAGFVVQTKHSVTSCEGNVQVACDIEVCKADTGDTEPESYSSLSIYIPEESKHFQFGPIGVDNKGFGPLPDSSSDVLIQTGSAATDKLLTSQPIPYTVKRAGTFMMEAKFLPFIPSITRAGDTILTPDNWTDIHGTTVTNPDGSITAAYDVSTTIQDPIDYPTKQNYLNSGIAPAAAQDLSLVWNIHITWYLWESVAGTCTRENATKKEEQSYLYKCNAVAVPCGDDLSWSSNIQPNPEPES